MAEEQDLQAELPELERYPDPVRQVVELLTSFEAWDRLRVEQGLSRARAEESLRAALLSLLGSRDE